MKHLRLRCSGLRHREWVKGLRWWLAAEMQAAVVKAKNRETNQVAAPLIQAPNADTLQTFVKDQADSDVPVCAADATAYESLPFDHDAVKHSPQEYVEGGVHTDWIKSLWSRLRRAHTVTLHELSSKRLDRNVREFAGRHNMRQAGTINPAESVRRDMEHKRLTYKTLIKDDGLKSGARAAA